MKNKDTNSKHSNLIKRNVGIQTITSTKEYLLPSVAVTHNLEIEEYSKIFAVPHNIAALIVLCLSLLYMSTIQYSTFEEGLKGGLIGVSICFVTFCLLHLPDSLLRRPHPVIWRLISSLGILYLLFILIILFQSPQNA